MVTLPPGARVPADGSRVAAIAVFVGLAAWLVGGSLAYSEPTRAPVAATGDDRVVPDVTIPAPGVDETLEPPSAAAAAAAAGGAPLTSGNAVLVDATWVAFTASLNRHPVAGACWRPGGGGTRVARRRADAPPSGGTPSQPSVTSNRVTARTTAPAWTTTGSPVRRSTVWTPPRLRVRPDRRHRRGTVDGSAAIDRAVGPMQFIPSTWEAWGADGNGDGSRSAADRRRGARGCPLSLPRRRPLEGRAGAARSSPTTTSTRTWTPWRRRRTTMRGARG